MVSKCGVSYTEAKSMEVHVRRWWINKTREEERKKEEEKKKSTR